MAEDPEDLIPGGRAHAIQFELMPVRAAGPQEIELRPALDTRAVRAFGLPVTRRDG